MARLRAALGEHRGFIIVGALLTVLTTFPTIVFVFRTDAFWLPVGDSLDIFVKLWDIWYGGKILTFQADRFYTDLLFAPAGVSLVNHPFFWPQVIVVGALQWIMPLPNAYSLSFLLIVFSTALAAYVYLLWLFEDKRLALFGSVVFGFCPNVVGNPHWPETAWLAVFPLVLYPFHRGLVERRALLVALAGALAGLTTEVTLYHYVQIVIMLGLAVCAFAATRWREVRFWRQVALLVLTLALFSGPRVLPMLGDRAALTEANTFYDEGETHTDLIAFVAPTRHPLLGPLAVELLQMPERAKAASLRSYLGVVALALIAAGLSRVETRRKMLPWLGLALVFLVLRLGSTLQINGVVFDEVLLPRHYLNQWFPFAFEPFNIGERFMAGARLPLAVLACFGLLGLRARVPAAARSGFVLALAAIVAFEFFIPARMTAVDPITRQPISGERLAFLDWLAAEENAPRLINLPLGRDNTKLYGFYQTLSGYPHAEGAISRTPDSAYDYLRANPVTSIWLEQRPTNCVIQGRGEYLAGIAQLLDDGFTHVVHHHHLYFWQRQFESFRYVAPAYQDDYVSIYRLADLLDSCPD